MATNDHKRLDVGSLAKEYQRQLRLFIRKRVASPEDAEDVLQDVFYKLARADALMTPIEHVSGWLYKVARRQIYDLLYKKRSTGANDGDVVLETPLDDMREILFSSDDDPEMAFLRGRIWREVYAALAELPPEQREAFELTELEGLSFKDIAAEKGVSVNTLISRKHYAVLHLRRRLTELYAELLAFKI